MGARSHPNDQRLKSVITLGSPHLGSLDTYSVWNGGKVANLKGISSIVFQILIKIQNRGLVTNLNKLRSYAPVMKDLLPTFDNYVSRNGQFLGQNQLETKNNFLINKNNGISLISDKLKLSVGVGLSTPNIVKLTNRSVFDKAFGLWPDGKFIGYDYGIGDNTVLKNSSSLGLSNVFELNSDHGEIVNNSLDFVMSNLGLESKDLDFVYDDNFSNSLVVFVGSPAKISVKCGNDIFEENDSFVIINNKNYDECILRLDPTDNGIVHLVLGNTNDNDWNYIEKNVVFNKPEEVLIDFKNGEVKTDKRNKEFLISWIKSDLQQIGLSGAIKYLDQRNLNRVVKMVFAYRWKTKEMIISQRILDNLFILGSINKPNKRMINYKWMYLNRDYLSRKTKFNHFSASSFEKLNRLINYMDIGIKKGYFIDEEMMKLLSDGYTMEILGN